MAKAKDSLEKQEKLKRKLTLWEIERKMPTERDFALETLGIKTTVQNDHAALHVWIQQNNWSLAPYGKSQVKIEDCYYEFTGKTGPNSK